MQIAVEVSLYPFRPDYEGPILKFIGRLKAVEGLRVEVNTMSTQVFGAFDQVMPAIQGAIREVFIEEHTAVLAMKVLQVNGGAQPMP
ncbi:hypothetical protein [Phaeodactylibacter luteus]|nr:hypothetical protein [Phaeodactylibacter luteus]